MGLGVHKIYRSGVDMGWGTVACLLWTRGFESMEGDSLSHFMLALACFMEALSFY